MPSVIAFSSQRIILGSRLRPVYAIAACYCSLPKTGASLLAMLGASDPVFWHDVVHSRRCYQVRFSGFWGLSTRLNSSGRNFRYREQQQDVSLCSTKCRDYSISFLNDIAGCYSHWDLDAIRCALRRLPRGDVWHLVQASHVENQHAKDHLPLF